MNSQDPANPAALPSNEALERSLPVVRVGPDEAVKSLDPVAIEEPLEVRVAGKSLLVTMRTPGHDFDLVRGLLFSEGHIERGSDVVAIAHCEDVPSDARGNVVLVQLAPGVTIDPERASRATIMTAACGVCGKAALEALRANAPKIGPGPRVPRSVITSLPERMRARQPTFAATGGLHAAALFDANGKLLSLREDVGRHNAVDKVIGDALKFDLVPLADVILMVSGRAGFEIVQKARRAGIPIACAVSAPSTLAVEVARDGGMTLIGFLRGERFNVYAGEERVG